MVALTGRPSQNRSIIPPVSAPQHPVAGHRLRPAALRVPGVRPQPQRVAGRPGEQVGLGQPGPPALVLEPEHPVRVASRPGRSAGPATFFLRVLRVRAGDPVLGPLPPDPQPLRGRLPDRLGRQRAGASTPSAWHTSATRASVHRLVGLPNSRGRRWSRSFRSSSRARGPRPRPGSLRACGLARPGTRARRRGTPGWRCGRPGRYSPTTRPMAAGPIPSALASRTWDRRTVNASADFRPRSQGLPLVGRQGADEHPWLVHPVRVRPRPDSEAVRLGISTRRSASSAGVCPRASPLSDQDTKLGG